MTAFVLVEDASEDGRGVEIRNTIGFDWTDGLVRATRGSEAGIPEPSKLTWKRRIRDPGAVERTESHCCSPVRLFSGSRCCGSGMSVETEMKGVSEWDTYRPWSAIAV